METYEYTTQCQNCGAENVLTIEKTKTVVAAIAVAVCTTCGCNVKQ